MGYYTYFRLEYKALDLEICKHENIEGSNFCHVCGISLNARAEKHRLVKYLESCEEDNWWLYTLYVEAYLHDKGWEHNNIMIDLSLKFPNILFTLHGEGEENDDLWRKYYLNGKIQVEYAQITYGEFDKEKLE